MARRPRLGKKLGKSLLPILLVLLLAFIGGPGWILYDISRPQGRAYLVTPQAFTQISGPGLKATDETWPNRDGTGARGWLLRGAEGSPAVVLLHRYGADRSWLFNLGVKLNETTNFTILWPDLRGHGLNPPVKWTSFGARESDDVLAALDYLKGLKTPAGQPLVGDHMGAYGVELGAYATLKAATRDTRVRVLVLDSVPANPDELLSAAVKEEIGIENFIARNLVRGVARLYFAGAYENTGSCELAATLSSQRVLVLSGADAGYLRGSSTALVKCFPNPGNIEVRTDLPLTGLNLPSATGEQGEGYDRRVIDFFDRNLRSKP
jgi:pimeloyl-ACP methyl ester carboxylesterase